MKRLLLLRSRNGVPLLIAGVLACLVLWVSAPMLLNTYDKENEIVVVNPPIRATVGSRNPYQTEYEKMLYPTVRITTPSGTGSGVIFETTDEHRLTQILTAAHVVDNQSVVDIELYDSRIITASVVITDTVKDLALLRVLCASAVKTYSASLAPKDYTPYIFTPVYSVGCSLGLPPRPSAGMITAIHHKDTKDTKNYWEVSSPILPGNSGGPVFDARTYEVIGIAVWVKTYQFQLITTMAGIVPINQIHQFLDSHRKGAENPAFSGTGSE